MATWRRFVAQKSKKSVVSSQAKTTDAQESEKAKPTCQKEDSEREVNEQLESSPSIRKLTKSKMSRSKLTKSINQTFGSQPRLFESPEVADEELRKEPPKIKLFQLD